MRVHQDTAWQERDVVGPGGERVHYFELADGAPWLWVVMDGRGTTYALFSFSDEGERERFVLVSPRRRGRATFYRNRDEQRFDYRRDAETIGFDGNLAPADVAMLIQRLFAPIAA